MVLQYKVRFFLTLFFISFFASFAVAYKGFVRVLISEYKKGDSFEIACADGFVLYDADTKKKMRLSSDHLRIRILQQSFVIHDQRYKTKKILIKPSSGNVLVYNGKPYKGSFLLILSDQKTILINRVPLEEYVIAVVQSESWPGWPVEVNKAFAIASRTYVASMIKRARAQKLLYDVRDDNNHQRYNLYGRPISTHVYEAVKSTQGLFLFYNNEPIIAMFDACCGGVIPAHIQDFNFEKAPYLARTYPCTFCKECRSYAWKVEHDKAELERLFQKANLPARSVKSMLVTHKDKAGIVLNVEVKDAQNKQHSIAGKRLYSLLDTVKSFAYGISMKSGKFVFSGKGLGHHLGMCQWGARQMVKEGYSYKQILSFYYPGARLKKI